MGHEHLSSQEPVSPGSLTEFAIANGMDANDPRVFAAYSGALSEYRYQIATSRGISLEELHFGKKINIGRISLEPNVELET